MKETDKPKKRITGPEKSGADIASNARRNPRVEDRRQFLRRTALVGGGTVSAMGIGGAGFLKVPKAYAAKSTSFDWNEDAKGRYGLFDSSGTEILSVDNRGQLALFYPYSRTGSGSDIRVDFSNSLFGSGIPRIAFAMKWNMVLDSQSFSVTSPQDWDVVYLMVGHLKITGFSGSNPVNFTVNYIDPPGDNFTATLCSVTPTISPQNTDFSPVCEDIHSGSKITISIDLGAGNSVANMQGYLTFVELDRRPGGSYNLAVPEGMNTGDANQQLMGFSTGSWDGQLK